MSTLELKAVQFFSRQFSREDHEIPKVALDTKEGRRLEGYLNVQFGCPLLVGACPGTKVRPNYAQPWMPQEGPSIGAVQWVDPYAEIRWPSYALATFNACLTPPLLDMPAACDILQRMRTLISFEIFELPELETMADQVFRQFGYRFGYWTSRLDLVGNPRPAPGKYVNADAGEPVGPGHASLFGFGSVNDATMHSLALVWSQAFSLPKRTTVQEDEARICKGAQKIKLHYNAKDELARAEDDLCQNDVKGCIRNAASAVDAALRHYCAAWGVTFPKKRISFDQKIEQILQKADRPSYRGIDSTGLHDLLCMYRSRTTMHEGDCYYSDEALGNDVYCDMSHARRFFDVAQTFIFWLDSQA